MKRHKLLSAFLCFLTLPAAYLLQPAAPEVSLFQTASDSSGRQVAAYAMGPGIDNLSLGDEFATYQWALKNYGEFQLTEMINRFSPLDYFTGAVDGSGKKRSPGPGTYDTKTTTSVAGMDINIKPAWDLYDGAANKRQVIVAIIDTGIDYTHQDLVNSIWTNPNETEDGIDNDGNGFVDDIHGWNFYNNNNQLFQGEEDSHGTHAAGTIGAARKIYGIAGITDNNYVKLMILKALGGSQGTGSVDGVINAIQYAQANGASICNLSLGTTTYDERLAQAIANSNMLFVIAAGNGDYNGKGYNTDRSPVYPASLPYDNIISVGNLLFDGNLDSSSNFGQASVDISAPGTYILSTIPGNQYAFMSGTSMAAPMVTGAAAMLYSYRTDISLADVKTILLNSSRKLDTLNGKVLSGGLLDVYGALTY